MIARIFVIKNTNPQGFHVYLDYQKKDTIRNLELVVFLLAPRSGDELGSDVQRFRLRPTHN